MDGKYSLPKLAYDEPIPVQIDQEEDWMKSILDELSEEIDSDVDFRNEKIKNPSFLRFNGSIIRKNFPKYGDVVFLEGELEGRFLAQCVSTGSPMTDHISVDVQSVFLDQSLKEEYGQEDEVSMYIDEGEYDLYFYESKKVDIKPVLHEYVFLNKNPYPRISEG